MVISGTCGATSGRSGWAVCMYHQITPWISTDAAINTITCGLLRPPGRDVLALKGMPCHAVEVSSGEGEGTAFIITASFINAPSGS
ncbi:hypothetical protein ALO61_200038 [Pseudomonas savastanoi pv. nerii]|nr:hypothetical protein ALO61_200038 [Pseudomonas savastanoi pv. nerii]